MKFKAICRLFVAMLAVSLSCNFATQNLPSSLGTGNLSATATSPVGVHLEWKSVSGASGYQLEARYGDGDYFPLATLAGEQTSYDHYVVPGSTDLTFRLGATIGTGQQPVGTADVHMPELKPDPLTVVMQAQLPAALQGATIDPNNFDPKNIDPGKLLPGFDPQHPENFDLASLTKSLHASEEIGPDGGSVTITGPDQVVYVLTVPPGALAQTVPVTLAPMGSISGLPMSGGLLGAVQLGPHIPFKLPLTLTFELPATRPAPAAPLTVGFSVSSFSNELSLYPADSDNGSTFSMSVDWGDAFGIASATPQDIQSQAAKIPTDAAGQMSQLIMALRSSNTVAGPEGDALLYNQLVEGLLQQLDQIVVQNPSSAQAQSAIYSISAPLAVHPAGNGPTTRAATQLGNAIEFADQMWAYSRGGRDASAQRLRAELVAKIKAFVQKTQQACLTQDAFYVGYILSKIDFARNNADASQNFWAWLAEGYGDIAGLEPCTFELEITSSIDYVAREFTTKSTVHTQKPMSLEIALRENKILLWGGGELTYDSYTAKVRACGNITVTPLPRISMWNELEVVFDDSGDTLADFTLSRFEINDQGMNQSLDVCGVSQPLGAYVGLWSSEFLDLRVPKDGAVQHWTADNGFAAGAPNVFRRSFPNHQAPTINGTATENTAFKLTVTPPK